MYWTCISVIQVSNTLTVCSFVRYAFQSESTHYSCLNVKELLDSKRRDIWSLSDCNRTRTHNHLVCKRTLAHLVESAKWLRVRLQYTSSKVIHTLQFNFQYCEDQEPSRYSTLKTLPIIDLMKQAVNKRKFNWKFSVRGQFKEINFRLNWIHLETKYMLKENKPKVQSPKLRVTHQNHVNDAVLVLLLITCKSKQTF